MNKNVKEFNHKFDQYLPFDREVIHNRIENAVATGNFTKEQLSYFQINDTYFPVINNPNGISIGSQIMENELLKHILPFYHETFVTLRKSFCLFVRKFAKEGATCLRYKIPVKRSNDFCFWSLVECHHIKELFFEDKHCFFTKIIPFHSYRPNEKSVILPDIYINGTFDKVGSYDLTKMINNQKPFKLSKQESVLIKILRTNPELNHDDIALLLGKTKNTIDKQSKQILAKAKTSFTQQLRSARDVVKYFEETGWFEENGF